MYSPFKYVKCFIDHDNHKVIIWQFLKDLLYKSNMQLSILYSTTGDLWYTLSDALLYLWYFVDRLNTSFNKFKLLFYRLKLTVDDTLYISDTCAAASGLIYPHHPRAKNLIRLAAKLMLKTGRKGLFLKKKTFGLSCPLCKDFSDDSSANLHCTRCLGTGIVGGYYNGIVMNILPLNSLQMTAITLDGLAQGLTIKCRCVAWPFIQHGDIWVDSLSNQRYYIDQITPLSCYMHVPLVNMLSMHLIELTDVIHSLLANLKVSSYIPNVDWLEDFKVN